jgi:hypothetical protein
VFKAFAISGSSQDTINKKLAVKISARISGIQIFEKESPGIKIPENIRLRRIASPAAPTDFTHGTDNPLRHGAYYVRVRAEAIYRSVKFQLDLYGEHRGVSYGVFNNSNTTVYPVLYLEGRDSFHLFRQKVIIDGKVGTFLNHCEDAGLLLYNLDTEGLTLDATVAKWSFGYSLFGDLYHGIGLNIDDFHSLRVNRTLGRNGKTKVGASLNMIAPPLAKRSDHLIWNVFANRNLNIGSIFLQVGYRNVNRSDTNFVKGIKEQLGVVAGVKIKKKVSRWQLNNQLEIRFYGKSFNSDRWSQELRYRDLSVSPIYGNTIGKHLYPLRKYETPFSQWAVFTEYQGSNIAGINWLGDIQYPVTPKFELGLEYDLMLLLTDRESANVPVKNDSFLYSFFTLNLLYTPWSDFEAGIILTNKGMNLDVGYPTLYQFKSPFLGIRLLADIPLK